MNEPSYTKIKCTSLFTAHSGPKSSPEATHHLTRPPGGFCAKQASALSFWLVERCHNLSDLCWFTHRAAVFKRLMNSPLDSNSVGIVYPHDGRRCQVELETKKATILYTPSRTKKRGSVWMAASAGTLPTPLRFFRVPDDSANESNNFD